MLRQNSIKKLALIITTTSFLSIPVNLSMKKAVSQTYDANGNFYDHQGRINQWYNPSGNHFSQQDFIVRNGQDLGPFLYGIYQLDVSYLVCSPISLSDIQPAICRQAYSDWIAKRSEIFQSFKEQRRLR